MIDTAFALLARTHRLASRLGFLGRVLWKSWGLQYGASHRWIPRQARIDPVLTTTHDDDALSETLHLVLLCSPMSA
jgi:hypothetical protein